MRIASRWVGWCSILLGTVGVLVATARTWRSEPDRAPVTDEVAWREYTWRAFTINDEADAIAAQACFDRYSGLVALQRDEDERAKLILVKEGTPLAACLQGRLNRDPRVVRTPTAVYFHQRIDDPWAPSTEAALFPPVFWHRCTGVTAHLVDADDWQSVSADAQACIGDRDMAFVDLELRNDGRVARVRVDSPADTIPNKSDTMVAGTACITRVMCQHRFKRNEAQQFAVIIPETRQLAAPVLKPRPDQ